MHDFFSSEFFSGNRERLRQLFTGTAPIVVTANGLMQKAADEAYPFEQDANFWYLTGIDEPDIILVIDRHKEYLIVPERETVREMFDGEVQNEQLTRISGIQTIYGSKEGWRQLGGRLKKVKHVATLAALPSRLKYFDMYTNPARAQLIKQMKEVNAELEPLDLREHLAHMRRIKQPQELAAIQAAVDLTVEGLRLITRPSALAKYSYEYELEADLTRFFRRSGADHAFSPIVAGGPRACTMHYLANNTALSADELLLLDVGSGVSHYASDLCRTVSIKSEPSRRQQVVYDAVSEALDYAISLLKPGASPMDVEDQMEQLIGEKLRELGLIKTIDSESVRAFYPHRAAHYLGLNTHDAGDYEALLVPNVVMACELGIYIPAEGIGIRLEDNIVITEEGNRILSDKLPRELV